MPRRMCGGGGTVRSATDLLLLSGENAMLVTCYLCGKWSPGETLVETPLCDQCAQETHDQIKAELDSLDNHPLHPPEPPEPRLRLVHT